MTKDRPEHTGLSEEELQQLVSSSDAGARNPSGLVAILLAVVAFTWSAYQVILASPIANYVFPGDVINNSRQIHLTFAIFLAFLAYPAFKSSPRSYIPVQDWLMAALGALIALYGFFVYEKLTQSGGLADDKDKWVALIGLFLLFEGARRALGPAMAIIATVFLAYVFFGSSEWVPDVIRWKGATLKKAMSHMWLTSEGVFGIALGVSTKFVFLFVLFGARLWFFLQDLPTLEQKYPTTWKSFLQVETKTFFGTDDPHTAELISNYLGEKTEAYEIPKYSSATSSGGESSLSFSISEDIQLTSRRLLKPDEVIEFLSSNDPTKPRHAIHFMRGIRPIRATLKP